MKPTAPLLAFLLLSAPALAATQTFTVTVAAGKHDRVNTPVRVRLFPGDVKAPRSATVRSDDGQALPAQVTAPSLLDAKPAEGCEVHFVLPKLASGASRNYQVSVSDQATTGAGFQWHDTPGKHTELRYADKPALRYMYEPIDTSSKERREQTYKVYHHLFDPTGQRLVTKGPGGQFTHHRGLFYGFNKVTYGDGKKCDVWHCTGDAHQAHRDFLAAEAGLLLGRHRLTLDWHGVGKEVFAQEQRELTVYAVPGGRLVEFASRLEARLSPVKLDGDPQHAGFHFRADNEVSAKTNKQTVYIRPDGVGKPGETRNWPGQKGHINLPWNAMSFVLGEQRYTAAYLDRPDNPKESRFSERDYGRFGSYFEHELKEGKPLRVNYRVWLQEGQMTGAEVAARSADFVEPPEVTVK